MTSQPLQHLINEWQGEMILACCVIQSSIINANTPASYCSCWYEFIFLICYHHHTTLFRNNVNGAHPFTIRNGIDDPCIKKFHHFLPHNLLHRRIQPPLWLHNRFVFIFHQNFVHTNGRADSFDVFNCPTNSLFVCSQNSQQLLFFFRIQ